jgi:hypothetical protein
MLLVFCSHPQLLPSRVSTFLLIVAGWLAQPGKLMVVYRLHET